MKKYSVVRSRTVSLLSWMVSLLMVTAGVALVASFFLGSSLPIVSGGSESSGSSGSSGGFSVPELGQREQPAGGPEDKSLTMTIPRMGMEDANVPNTEGSDMGALRANAAIHLQGTGFPWEKEANVYIAGHRLGYPATDSFLSFFDLDSLENGDEVYLTDSTGREYTYRVSTKRVVGPADLSVTEPVPGKNIVTLQSCTLPDYSQRLIVQAELVERA